MLVWILRALFLLVLVSVLVLSLSAPSISGESGRINFYVMLCAGSGLGIISLLLDILTPKKSLAGLAGVFFGLLVGIIFSWGLAQILDGLVEIYRLTFLRAEGIDSIKWMMGICVCFIVISIVIRTKDDVRFVIPYVEFSKQTKGLRPLVLDTSVIIDGRIADLCMNKVFDGTIIVPRFVLNELQLIADSSDKLKRTRGRRGLDILARMQENQDIDIEIDESLILDSADVVGVDHKLIIFSKKCNGKLLTTDYNLTKVAKVRNVDVININDLANSMKSIAIPGESMEVKIIKPGEEAEQGIGYLEDGTMVVVEGARYKIGKDILISITSSLQTSAGKMIFGKYEGFAQKSYKNGGQESNS
jgi:uncharacterized protein YacL